MAEIVSTPEVLGGKPRIDGRRIGVHHIVDEIQAGRTPEEMTVQFDLTLGEVYTALAYYHEHPKEMRELRAQIAENIREHRGETIVGPEDLPEELRSNGEPSQRPRRCRVRKYLPEAIDALMLEFETATGDVEQD